MGLTVAAGRGAATDGEAAGIRMGEEWSEGVAGLQTETAGSQTARKQKNSSHDEQGLTK